MKKLLIVWMLSILTVFPLQAQEVVILPKEIAEELLLDAEQKDKYIIELNKRDSTLTVYEAELQNRTKAIRECVLTVDEYKVLITKLEANETDLKSIAKDQRRQINKLKIKNTLGAVLMIAETIIIITLIII